MNNNDTDIKPSVTIREVASMAGVSVGTVSRVLNGYENITQENLEKVQEAISALGYRKCRSAEMLGSRRNGSRIKTGNIGIVFVGMSTAWAGHPLIGAYMLGSEQACQEKGYHALLEMCGTGTELPRCVREGKIDGLLIKATRALPEFFSQIPSDLPIVCVGMNDPIAPVHQVASDDRGSGWEVTEYLWQQGHRRIAFICQEISHPILLARYQGYESYLRPQRTFDPELVALEDPQLEKISTPQETPPDLTAALQRVWSAKGGHPTAIVACNDWGAQGLYTALAAAGLRVPEDVSVVSFDNIGSATMSPPLTSYAAPFSEIARVGSLNLFARIENPEKRHDRSIHLIRGDLIKRASSQTLTATA